MNANGSFKLLTQDHTYILKGHGNKLFGPLPHTFAVCVSSLMTSFTTSDLLTIRLRPSEAHRTISRFSSTWRRTAQPMDFPLSVNLTPNNRVCGFGSDSTTHLEPRTWSRKTARKHYVVESLVRFCVLFPVIGQLSPQFGPKLDSNSAGSNRAS
jgi:hypothetical protein